MSNKVNPSPQITPPQDTGNFFSSLIDVFREHANTLNSLVSEQLSPTIPNVLPTYVKTALPSAATYINAMIIVSNDVGGLTPAFSDGTNWRRVADRNVIS